MNKKLKIGYIISGTILLIIIISLIIIKFQIFVSLKEPITPKEVLDFDIDYRIKYYMGEYYNKSITIDVKTLPKNLGARMYYYSSSGKRIGGNKYFESDLYIEKEFKKYLKSSKIPKNNYFIADFGDVQNDYKNPILTKTRPINTYNNILLKIQIERHYGMLKDFTDISFDQKIYSKPIWRGVTTGNETRPGNRFNLVKKYFNDSRFDIAFNGIWGEDLIAHKERKEKYKMYIKNKISIEDQLKHKYLISIEGNDVATGLKWMLLSNSVVLMPKPTICSWIMEDHLKPWVHFVPLDDDFNDLPKRLNWCEKHPKECIKISANATNYMDKFLNEDIENFINYEILRRYANNINVLTDQLQKKKSNLCNIVSKSQVGQDKWVTSQLNCKKGGFYIDIGARDGEEDSNSVVLDKQFKFKGLCVDPFPKNMENRTCKVIRKAVYNSDNESLDFINPGSGLGGLSIEIGPDSMHYNSIKDKDHTTVKTITPSTLFADNNVPPVIDYLTIDIEGGELEVLKNIPFDQYCIKHITVEHNFEEPRRTEIRNLLLTEGYSFAGAIEQDDCYSKECPEPHNKDN